MADPTLAPELRQRRTLTIASLATLATFLDTTILFVAFPDIGRTFSDTSPATLSWVLNAYTIVFAALLIPAGKIADRVGHRRAFLAGSALFTIASGDASTAMFMQFWNAATSNLASHTSTS